MAEQRQVLARCGELRITHDFEDAFLEVEAEVLPLCEHYGDPQCALFSPAGDWCVVGGEGLDVFLLGSRGDRPVVERHATLWRRETPPPDGARCWFVSELSLAGDGRVIAVVETADARRRLEVDLRRMVWRTIEA